MRSEKRHLIVLFAIFFMVIAANILQPQTAQASTKSLLHVGEKSYTHSYPIMRPTEYRKILAYAKEVVEISNPKIAKLCVKVKRLNAKDLKRWKIKKSNAKKYRKWTWCFKGLKPGKTKYRWYQVTEETVTSKGLKVIKKEIFDGGTIIVTKKPQVDNIKTYTD